MSNHYHFLVRASDSPLVKLMAPVLGGYAGYYNRKYQRSGYVFQNRYKSILCDADSYLKELIRYIHLNPVRAEMAENAVELERYQWTGHAGVFGRYLQSWHEVDGVLGCFGNSRRIARKRYRQFMMQSDEKHDGLKLSGGGLIRSYGGWETLSRMRS